GIGPREGGGIIRLIVSGDEEYIYVTVSDDGVGMTQETIKRLLRDDFDESTPMRKAQKGHTTGIGVDNVLKRLRLFFGCEDVMCIECSGGETRVIFTLPRKPQEDGYEAV
ncbi:MAG: sensor histidine kinase, partial [Acetanaerobacterium sp.]